MNTPPLPCPFCGVVPEPRSTYIETGASDGHNRFAICCDNLECKVRPYVMCYGPSSITGQSG